MPTATVTSKGQITIPKEIREQLRLSRGHRVDFQVNPAGEVVLKPRNRDYRLLRGLIRSPRRKPVSLREMDRAIAEGAAGS